MKKLLQMKFMLLLCALIVGSGTMWAEDVTTTYIFTNRDWNATCGGEAANWTCNTRASGYTDGQGTQITTSGNGANATSPVSFTNVKSIVVTYCTNKSKGNGTIKVKIGSGTEKTFTVTAPSSDGTTLKTTEFTYNPTESGAVTLTVNCSTNSVYIYSIAITTESANTPSSPLASITLSGDNYPTTFYVGDTFSHEGMTVTATYVNETTKDVTTGATFSGYDMSTAGVQTVTVSYTQGEGDNAITKSATYNITVKGLSSVRLDGQFPLTFTEGDAFSHEGMTVYAVYTDGTNGSEEDVTSDAVFSEPDMTTVGNQNVTVSYTKNNVTKSTEYEITINALPTHNVTWSVNGTVTEPVSYKEGEAITFPANNPTDIDGKSFVGWTETAISGTTDETPTFVTSATMGEENITFYAVFATIEQSGEDTYEILSSNAFDANATYVIGAKQSANDATMWYFYSYGDKVDENASWGKMTTSPATVAPITFTLSGKADELIAQANTGHYLKGLSTGNFQMSASSQKIALDENGNIKNGNYALRHNYNSGNGGLRWYSSATGQPANFFKVIPGTTYSGYCTTVAADTRSEAGLAFEQTEYSVELFNAASFTSPVLSNPNELSPITWTSSNETVATVNEGTVTILSEGETTIKAKFEGNDDYKPGEASYVLTVQDSRLEPTVTIDATGITNTNRYTGTTAGSLAATVTYNEATIDGAKVTWSGNNDEVATINEETGVVTLVAAGTVTFTATYAGNSDYAEKTATYVMTVTNVDPNAPGSENNPYTVAEAIAATPASGTTDKVYIKGIVSKFYNTSIVGDGSNYRYYISDDGTTTNQLIVYRGKGLNEQTFSSADDLQIGDKVVIYGGLTMYNNASEVASGNYIVSLVRKPAAPTFSPAAGTYTSTKYVTISAADGAAIYYTTDGTDPTTESTQYSGAITVNESMTIKAIAVKDSEVSDVATAEYVIDLTPSIVFDDKQSLNVLCTAGEADIHFVASNITGTVAVVLCDANGGAATYDWFSAVVTNDAYVHVTWQANTDTENSRTAYFKLTSGATESEIFEFTQAKYVPDYATLPFTFDGGKNAIEAKSGLTQNGLGNDYASSPKLKFDNTGDWMILKINEIPGTLTFDIKGNGFSDGTFTVQTSADGTTYTDLATYKDLGDTQTETFNNLAANVRYIKWIYTEKSSGNVGLGNITLGNTMAVAIAAACTDGTKCYSTFSSSKPFIVPEDLTVSEIGIEDGTMNVVNYATGETVPANTGVMVSATTFGEHKLIISSEAGTSVLGAENRLRPTGDNDLTATEMNSAEPETCKFYRLTMHDGTKLGFWWGADGGQSFDIAANKAYLAVPASVAGARNGFAFGDDATGISNVNVNENVNGSVFDLQGRKVSTPGKGLYIVNGKKVVIK